ncbi:MAG: alpha/beta fold hydrolase [Acidimicrobiales bacterium]|nr:alpha/beta fold hydrolase [Acidimicrobiales bacterium]
MAPPVVLLHGFATSTERTWREPGWFDLLKDARRRAFGIDLLGHGDAPKPTDPADYDDLVTPVIEQFPETPADIVGYSLGARTALQIAMQYPDRVNRIVLAAVGRNLVAADDADEMANHTASRFESLITTPGNDPNALRACIGRERPRFTADELATVQAPCLIIIGSDDFAGPPEPLADALPDCQVKVLPGVDHFGLPKQFSFIDAALEFIDAVPTWD